MVPLFFSPGNLLQLMVIRDSEAPVKGQFIITKTYRIFQDMALVFTYTAGGKNQLSEDEVEQLIELIEA